jgi:hypothetical protein
LRGIDAGEFGDVAGRGAPVAICPDVAVEVIKEGVKIGNRRVSGL